MKFLVQRGSRQNQNDSAQSERERAQVKREARATRTFQELVKRLEGNNVRKLEEYGLQNDVQKEESNSLGGSAKRRLTVEDREEEFSQSANL